MKRVLAFDFGASSGRAILGIFDGEKIELQEVHRFSNDPVKINGTVYWDVQRLFFEIKQGILKAKEAGGFDSIGIDTWGVDFGLLRKDGTLVENPVHYRDARNDGMVEKATEYMSKERMYDITGIQFMDFNTIFQLLSLKENRPYILEEADKLLFMPDLLNYMLSGVKSTEFSIATTSQMVDLKTNNWSEEILDTFGINKNLLTDIAPTGAVIGQLSDEICEELGVPKADIVSVAAHDTQSAITATPCEFDDFAFISCGTWSLFGTEVKEPIINEASKKLNVTNEGGYDYRFRYLKNIMGLWMIQSVKKEIGEGLSFGEICEAASKTTIPSIVDANDDRFLAPENMTEEVKKACAESGQAVPADLAEVASVIYNSLAKCYGKTIEEIEALTGKTFDGIHIVGGGSNAEYLNQLTAKATGKTVYAGPTEATAIGNLSGQMIAGGELADLQDARNCIFESFEIKIYQ